MHSLISEQLPRDKVFFFFFSSPHPVHRRFVICPASTFTPVVKLTHILKNNHCIMYVLYKSCHFSIEFVDCQSFSPVQLFFFSSALLQFGRLFCISTPRLPHQVDFALVGPAVCVYCGARAASHRVSTCWRHQRHCTQEV